MRTLKLWNENIYVNIIMMKWRKNDDIKREQTNSYF